MSKDEIEIESDEEYEVMPLSPIRKLEKRIEDLEKEKESGEYKGIIREVMSLVKSNQQMVDEIVKSNNELRLQLEKIPRKVDQVLDQWEEFLDILEESEKQSRYSQQDNITSEKLEKLIELNQELLESMDSIKKGIKFRVSGGSESGGPKLRIKRGSESHDRR